jgi:hypothetical protein
MKKGGGFNEMGGEVLMKKGGGFNEIHSSKKPYF